MTKEEAQVFADLLNELHDKAPQTLYSWSTSFYFIPDEFVEHPDLSVRNIPWRKDSWMVTNLSIINACLSKNGFYLVGIWGDPDENDICPFHGYRVMSVDEIEFGEPVNER